MPFGDGQEPINATSSMVMRNHVIVRDGSVWLCRECKGTWPYPAPIPAIDGQTCTPRPWVVAL
jgi:hypothetical protein